MYMSTTDDVSMSQTTTTTTNNDTTTTKSTISDTTKVNDATKGAYLVVRIKGQADVPYWASHTMSLMRLERKYRATILPAKENTLGMLNKIKHYVAWTTVDSGLVRELVDKKARKSGYRKVTIQDIASMGYADSSELADALTSGSAVLSKLKQLKPWFALAPPRHGFKRSTKRLYGQKGVLGNNPELDTTVRSMMIE